ncbi:MAG: alpha/beta hydrolase-fold protein [Myxococcota bacterium]
MFSRKAGPRWQTRCEAAIRTRAVRPARVCTALALACATACTLARTTATSSSEKTRAEKAWAPASAPAQTWTRERLPDVGAEHIRARPIELMIPEGDPPTEGWPFLVVTDGDSAFTETFRVGETMRALVDEGRIEPRVVIAVPSRDRTRELTPQRRGVASFAAYVVEVVLPAARAIVPLSEDGAILGYSFGGLAAAYFGVRYPELFGRVVAMSPSVWFRQRRVLRAVHEAEAIAARWWVDVGTREGHPRDVVPYMVADARQLRREVERRNAEVGYLEAPGRAHDSNEAGLRMRWALDYALRDENCDPVEIELHILKPDVRPGDSTATSVLTRCADGSPRSVDAAEVEFRADGLRTAQDGVLWGRRRGTYEVVARTAGLEARARLRIR